MKFINKNVFQFLVSCFWLFPSVFAWTLELNQEEVPADEEASIQEVLRISAERFKLQGDVKTRDVHTKDHGCIKASFEVLEGLSPELRKGIFSYKDGEPAPKYKSWIRYSNGDGKIQPDYIPDSRAMAVKVIGVPGERVDMEGGEKTTKDFLMINHPVFWIKNAKEYVSFLTATNPIDPQPLNFFATRPLEFGIVKSRAAHFVSSLLETSFFSMTPIRYEERAIKYKAKPCTDQLSTKIASFDLERLKVIQGDLLKLTSNPVELKNYVQNNAQELEAWQMYLRKTMAQQLTESEYCYEFQIQFQEDPVTMPIEDPRIEWTSKFHTVAKIYIPIQSFGSGEKEDPQDLFCENLSMMTWNSPVSHKPMGGVQRVRKAVYPFISKARHTGNGVQKTEPTGNE